MATRPRSLVFTGVLCLLLASLPGCSKSSNPTGPAADPNAAMYGVWTGTMTGPDIVQQSGWSSGSVDSIWVVFHGPDMRYSMSPTVGSQPFLSLSSDTCFVTYPSALNSLSDPQVSFRVNFTKTFHLVVVATSVATRDGSTLTGTMTLPGDTLSGHWTAKFCSTCPDSAEECP